MLERVNRRVNVINPAALEISSLLEIFWLSLCVCCYMMQTSRKHPTVFQD